MVQDGQRKSVVWARHVSAGYDGGPPALTDINLSLPPRQLIAIVGPNGAGKSTLLSLLMGIKKPSGGQLRVLDQPMDRLRGHGTVAYVPQHEQIDWDYPICVWDVVLGGRYGHMRSGSIWKRFLPPRWAGRQHQRATAEALRAVDLLSLRGKPIGTLSGGERKRVFLARALAQNSELLLLDEPLVGVDQKSEALIFRVLAALNLSGHSVIMVTHDLASARRYADHVVLINKTVIASGLPDEVLDQPHISKLHDDAWSLEATPPLGSNHEKGSRLSMDPGGYSHVDSK